jgi:O-antigen ligase
MLTALFEKRHKVLLTDGWTALVAFLLPWSTSATLIALGIWLLAWVLTFEVGSLWRELKKPPCLIPVLLWLLAAMGMLWSEASWPDRWVGLQPYHKLLAIPLLWVQFRESPRAHWILLAFLASCTALLALSFGFELAGASWRFAKQPGVPVRDYIAQSGEFLLCGLSLLACGIVFYRRGQHRSAAGSLLLSLLFFLNLIYVASARTTIVVAFVLVIFLTWRLFAGTQKIAATFLGVTIVLAFAFGSHQMRDRIDAFWQELELHQSDSDRLSSTAIRLEMWQRSLAFVTEAPVFGHGTGSIKKLFRESATGDSALAAIETNNPHQQVLAIAIQLGLVGVMLLLVMWLAHVRLFFCNRLLSLVGAIIVIQNVTSSVFNSHLFDFSQGWLYVLGVGVTGATGARRADKINDVRASQTNSSSVR